MPQQTSASLQNGDISQLPSMNMDPPQLVADPASVDVPTTNSRSDDREMSALRIGSARRDGAGFAIGRNHNSAHDRGLSTFLDGEVHSPIIQLRVGACV